MTLEEYRALRSQKVAVPLPPPDLIPGDLVWVKGSRLPHVFQGLANIGSGRPVVAVLTGRSSRRQRKVIIKNVQPMIRPGVLISFWSRGRQWEGRPERRVAFDSWIVRTQNLKPDGSSDNFSQIRAGDSTPVHQPSWPPRDFTIQLDTGKRIKVELGVAEFVST